MSQNDQLLAFASKMNDATNDLAATTTAIGTEVTNVSNVLSRLRTQIATVGVTDDTMSQLDASAEKLAAQGALLKQASQSLDALGKTEAAGTGTTGTGDAGTGTTGTGAGTGTTGTGAGTGTTGTGDAGTGAGTDAGAGTPATSDAGTGTSGSGAGTGQA